MAEITCHVKDCLNNKHNKCTANAIVLGGNVMKHSRKQHWSGGMYGVSHSHIPGALKVLQMKNILRGSSEPREIAS